MADGSVIIDAELNDSKFQGGLSKLGGVAGGALKGLGAGMAALGSAAAAGAVALGKAVISSYADYEQLVGGVDTLFKDSSSKLQEYAANAYKTAGMGANEYMSTVTSFSASLISSLGGDTEKAADYADGAVTDMADNANKMGTSMESIQNAYQGFAKQNYTMLDNLKLGYGGTKEEMQRLLDDASKISGIKYDISSFADVTQAIHVMQESMGIAGATAAEAEGTISGSIASLGGAWSNFITGLGDKNANLPLLVGNVADAFQNVLTNVTPIIENIVRALPDALTSLMPALQEMLPVLIETVSSLFTGALDALVSMLPTLIPVAMDAVMAIVNGLIDNLPAIIEAGITLIIALVEGLIEAIPQLVARLPEIIVAIVTGLGKLLYKLGEVGLDLVKGIWEGISGGFKWIVDKLKGWVNNVLDYLKKLFGINSPSKVMADEIGKFLPPGIAVGFELAAPKATKDMMNEIDGMTKSLNADISSSLGANLMNASVSNMQSAVIGGNVNTPGGSGLGTLYGGYGSLSVIIEEFNNYDTERDIDALARTIDNKFQKMSLQRARGLA